MSEKRPMIRSFREFLDYHHDTPFYCVYCGNELKLVAPVKDLCVPVDHYYNFGETAHERNMTESSINARLNQISYLFKVEHVRDFHYKNVIKGIAGVVLTLSV